MNFDRLPKSSREAPFLYGAFDTEKKVVRWCLDDTNMWDRDDMQDGTNWFQVWAADNKICVQATQWFSSEGEFSLIVSLVTPSQAVVGPRTTPTISSMVECQSRRLNFELYPYQPLDKMRGRCRI